MEMKKSLIEIIEKTHYIKTLLKNTLIFLKKQEIVGWGLFLLKQEQN